MTTTAVRPPVSSMELGGSGLAGARHLRDEREKRRRARRTRKEVASSASSASASPGFGYADVAAARVGGGGASPRAPRVSPRQRRRVEDTHVYLCAKVDPVMGALILALVEGRPKNVRQAALDHLLSKKDRGGGRTGTAGGGTATVADCDGLDDDDLTRDRLSSQQDDRETNRRKERGGNSNKTHNNGAGVSSSPAAVVARRLAERQDRLFMAREIGPLVTELITRTLRAMPTEVEDFLIEQLQGIASSAVQREGTGNGGHGFLRHDTQKSHPAEISPREESRKDRPNGHDESEPQQRSARPSTARSRLEEARNLDLQAQETLHPMTEGAEAGPCTSAGMSNGPRGANLLLDGDNSSVNGDDAPLPLSEREKVVAVGVKESLNKPWDMEISSKVHLPPPEAEPAKGPQLAVILLLGLDGAGKTTLLGTLQGEHDPKVRPSVGFKPTTMMLSDQLKVKFYDLGGGKNIRSIWDKYYHDAHGLLYVVDGADGDRWGQSRDLFLTATSHKYLRGKPVAVILNKEDAGAQVRPEDAAGDLGLAGRSDAKVCCCSVNTAKSRGGAPDERLEGAVEWLLASVKESFDELNERVQRDLQDMERVFQLEKERKQLGVLRGLLRKAFPEAEGAEREDCFDEAEGLEFLAGEVGLEAGALSTEGAEIAALVGYQKLALQMVGNMKSPISRKNRARSWEEIRQLVVELRRDAGIVQFHSQ